VSTSPLISIALCTYNGAEFLPAQLESLLSQDWENLEIVAVDDGSTDGTREILLDHAARDPRLSVTLNERNLGFLANFEKALALTQGEFIAPCDQDDWWHPGKLRGLHAAIGACSLAYCDSLFVDARGHSLNRKASDVLRMYEGNDPAAFVFANCVSGHAMLVRRSLLERALPFPYGRFHDWWLAFAAASTEGLVYVPEPWVHYRQHGSAQTDLSGLAGRGKKNPPRWVEMAHRRAWIASLAGFPSPHQAYFQALLGAWDAWTDSWFCPELVARLLERRDSLFSIHRRASRQRLRRSFRYFWGLKLRRLLLPWRYRPGAQSQ
jgi:glycosyltransferase involved in cell wall biosynthesis